MTPDMKKKLFTHLALLPFDETIRLLKAGVPYLWAQAYQEGWKDAMQRADEKKCEQPSVTKVE